MSVLSKEDQDDILFWPETVGAPTFQAVTRVKDLHVAGWQEIDFSQVDYKSNLQNGLYDNGIAIRTGKTCYGKYLIVLDFDGQDAVEAWFGSSWDNVIATAKRTRIEWHNDKTRLHYFILADRPIPNRRIQIKESLLEVRCEKQALFVSPSVHKDGEKYAPIDSKTIAEITQNQLMGLHAQIDSLCKGYMSDLDKEAYDKWLDLPTTTLGVSQGRHLATVFKVSSYYWRQNDGWLDLDDNERFKRAWVWHLAHCNPPRTLEFKRICKWVVDTCKTERDRVHAEARQNRDLFARLEAAQAEAEEKQKQKQEQNENAITTTDRLAGNNNDEFSDYENELIKEFHFKTLIDSKDIWYYNKNLGVYEEYGDIIIESKVEQRGYTNKQVAETLGHIRRRTYTKRAAFDSNIEWIACKNCMINLKTGKTAPFDPKFMNTTYLPVIYDPKIEETQSLEENPISSFFRMIEWTKPNVLLLKEIIKSSQCPAITKFLYDIMTPADVELLLDFMTYSLWRNYKFHNWILLVGYGQNGKSTFLTLLEMFFHMYSAESLERLLNDRFAPAQLYKKLINIDADISGDILEKASGKLKKLTGNDEFAAETKYKAPFKFRNFAKLYFSCNKIPKIG